MNVLNLTPNDVLFFRDGRPMEGASSGSGAAWPMPNVISAAFHAALHRAEINGVHEHRRGRSSDDRSDGKRDRKFGGLVTAGPFPVSSEGRWIFPRPADARRAGDAGTTEFPLVSGAQPSSLSNDPKLPLYPVVSAIPPSKDSPEPWVDAVAYTSYLNGGAVAGECHRDADIFGKEHQIGIGIAPETGTVEEGKFYSAQYLRLTKAWQLGVLAEAQDKISKDPENRRDLIRELLDSEQHILVGGQQRVCNVGLGTAVDTALPLPVGPKISGTRVRWTLLSPAVFPHIAEDKDRGIPEHSGGSLPTWVDCDGVVQLLDGPGKNKAKRMRCEPGRQIQAHLVAACVPGSQPVSGWALGHDDENEAGARALHLAVPAGSVYYFEAEDSSHAQKLADVLSWHGSSQTASTIHNRRSTLLGEKGFGLGVCSAWSEYTA